MEVQIAPERVSTSSEDCVLTLTDGDLVSSAAQEKAIRCAPEVLIANIKKGGSGLDNQLELAKHVHTIIVEIAEDLVMSRFVRR